MFPRLLYKVFLAACCVALTVLAAPVSTRADAPVPQPLEGLQSINTGVELPSDDTEIRNDAMREAALSFGARGGLARRTWEIRRQLDLNASSLSQAFDFRRLLVSAPSGLLIEPPVVTEAQKAFLVAEEGQTAAVADRLYSINQQARIVSAPREWRTYMERDWGEVAPPPALLLPKNAKERELWKKWVLEGWQAGVTQANDIFEADLDRLERDFRGMVRYRELLAYNMISPPFAALEDRGVTGGGGEMRVGDRQVRITSPSELNPQAERWLPARR
ncbi:MAG: type IV secretion system DotC family protein [Pseudomonadota bacterium]|nr:type IV secretion system DotC family protein [Pseudomonadota bacterium]